MAGLRKVRLVAPGVDARGRSRKEQASPVDPSFVEQQVSDASQIAQANAEPPASIETAQRSCPD
jgi:hypothetical protein